MMRHQSMEQLKTDRLLLRKLRREDAALYYKRLGSSEAVTRYMLWTPHKEMAESVASIEKALRRYEEGECYRWGVALQSDDTIIGVVELLKFDKARSSCSFAYMLAEEFWGKGYGTEALSAALNFAFEKLEVNLVEADYFADNEASGAVMRRVGMKYVTTQVGKYEKNGVKYDAPVYRITRDMWENS